MRDAEHGVDDAALGEAAARLGQALLALQLRLALAESCTGGWIAKAITDIPGASDWFEAGFVTYSNEAKIEVLGVSAEVLAEHGAVSEPVVQAMAAGARRVARTGAALAVSGVAGPAGGSSDKPVGLVWFGFSVGQREWAERADFDGDREAVRRHSVEYAIESLRRAL